MTISRFPLLTHNLCYITAMTNVIWGFLLAVLHMESRVFLPWFHNQRLYSNRIIAYNMLRIRAFIVITAVSSSHDTLARSMHSVVCNFQWAGAEGEPYCIPAAAIIARDSCFSRHGYEAAVLIRQMLTGYTTQMKGNDLRVTAYCFRI